MADPATHDSAGSSTICSQLRSHSLMQGSQWWVLPRAAVVYLVTDPSVKLLWHYIKHTHIPDESFWHTALVSSMMFTCRQILQLMEA